MRQDVIVTTDTDQARPGLDATARPGAPEPRARFRPDIEGLRAVAVLLVVLSHAGVPFFGGGYVGVDVFFVISGFIITTLLLGELDRRGTISVAAFYARRATRLLPLATAVIVATAVASWYWLPPSRIGSILTDALASAVYGINYRLALQGTDYLAADMSPSPFRHFWSLAVEEQFYLVWPMLLVVASLAWLGRGRPRIRPVVVVLVLVVIGSFAVSVWETQRSAPWAYFGAHTRVWELGLGALVAVGAGVLARIPGRLAGALTWVGLAAVLVAALRYGEHTAYPGYAAALPVVGTALIISGGCAVARGGAGLLLHRPALQVIGKLSYGWYLWHWPVLIIGPAALGLEPSLRLNLLLAAGALGLAAVSYVTVENPLRRNRWWRTKPRRGITLGASLSALVVLFALAGAAVPPPTRDGGAQAPDTRATLAEAADPGEALADLLDAYGPGFRALPSNLVPPLVDAPEDIPVVYDDGCHLGFDGVSADDPCVYGDESGSRTMVLLGDSHAAHWQPALDEIAESWGWQLVSLTKSACPAPSVATINPVLDHPYEDCVTWRTNALERIRQQRPELVIMSSNGGSSGGLLEETDDPDQVWLDGWRETVRLTGLPESQVVMIADTPWPDEDIPDCVATHPQDSAPCAMSVEVGLIAEERRELVMETLAAEGVRVIDPTRWFCVDGECPPVVGNVLVYRDHSHISATYSRILAPVLAAELPD